jgi:hypothetical protein
MIEPPSFETLLHEGNRASFQADVAPPPEMASSLKDWFRRNRSHEMIHCSNRSGRPTLINGTNPSCAWLSQSLGGWRWLTVLRVPGCIGPWLARHQHWFSVALRSSPPLIILPSDAGQDRAAQVPAPARMITRATKTTASNVDRVQLDGMWILHRPLDILEPIQEVWIQEQ